MTTATIRRRRRICGGIRRGRGGRLSAIPNSLAILPGSQLATASIEIMSSTDHQLTEHHVSAVRTRVLDWYADNGRDLPWRDPETTAWGVLVSEVMLQQTQVSRVWDSWLAWMKRWPGPADWPKLKPPMYSSCGGASGIPGVRCACMKPPKLW